MKDDFSSMALPAWRGRLVTLPPIASSVRHTLSRPSSCVPPGFIALTYYSPAHATLRELQLERVQSKRCFMTRLVTVCFGVAPNSSALDSSCVSAPAIRGAPSGHASTFRKPAYHELIWAKWRLMHDALSEGGARGVLFVDSDVLLFRNPFRALGAAGVPRFDLMFQGELACDGSESACAGGQPPSSCHLNGGVLLAQSAALVARVILRGEADALAAASASSARAGGASAAMLDQDVAESVLRSSDDFRACHLPSQAFVGFCMWAW